MEKMERVIIQKKELMTLKQLPIGIENFKEILDKKYYYVDKTMFIEDVSKEKVALYTRPRRFGKTLNMSMLYYFFSIKEKENSYLFDSLAISKRKEIIQHQNQYPVIFLSMKDMKNSSFQNQKDSFKGIIREVIGENLELEKSDRIDESDKEMIKRYREGNVNTFELKNSLRFISQCLKKHYQRNVILIIDEYDVPLQTAYLKGYYEEMTEFLSGIFSAVLKTNDSLEKGILSGCLRIAKESIFTGLNNFNVYSIFQQQSSTAFGFTPEETVKILKDFQLKSYETIVKDWYDGYLFGKNEIYNPWSVLKFVQKAVQDTPLPESFWANTSGNDIIYRYIQQGSMQMKHEFDMLTSGETIEKTIKPELTYREMNDTDNIYSFLLFTGYLKVVKQIGLNSYDIKIPNKEIGTIYIQIFSQWFEHIIKENSSSFYEALLSGDEEMARKILNAILFQSISYFDAKEDFYHGFLAGMLQGFHVISNRESGAGRFDLAVIPDDFSNRGMILECKHAASLKSLKKESEIAAKQIKEKQYIEGYLADGYTNFIGYGIAFYKKSCYITKLN